MHNVPTFRLQILINLYQWVRQLLIFHLQLLVWRINDTINLLFYQIAALYINVSFIYIHSLVEYLVQGLCQSWQLHRLEFLLQYCAIKRQLVGNWDCFLNRYLLSQKSLRVYKQFGLFCFHFVKLQHSFERHFALRFHRLTRLVTVFIIVEKLPSHLNY